MTILKKHKKLLLHILAIGLAALLVIIFVEEIQQFKQKLYYKAISIVRTLDGTPEETVPETTEPVPETTAETIPAGSVLPEDLKPVENRGDEWYLSHPLIYHAAGTINDNTYTNSLEAVENSLSNGYNFLEIDFSYTIDGHLVCAHSWWDVYRDWYHPTLEEFKATKVQGEFTPLTAADLIELMRAHPELHVVTDIKEFETMPQVVGELVELAGQDPYVLDRFIIQLYTGREKPAILEYYPFKDEQFVFTIYEWGPWDLAAAKICNEENIAVLTVPYWEMPDEDVALLNKLGFTIYEHTVNRVDYAVHSLKRGVPSFYTDCLTYEDLVY